MFQADKLLIVINKQQQANLVNMKMVKHVKALKNAMALLLSINKYDIISIVPSMCTHGNKSFRGDWIFENAFLLN